MFLETFPKIKKVDLPENNELKFNMSDGSTINAGKINPGTPNNITSSGINVHPIDHIENVSELPDNVDPGTLYIAMDTSDMYLYTGNKWDAVGSVPEDKKNVPFSTCPKCGAPMKSFICEYCDSDFTYLR